MSSALGRRVEAILRGDAGSGLVASLVANAEKLAEIANHYPPDGATVHDAHLRPLSGLSSSSSSGLSSSSSSSSSSGLRSGDSLFSHVYVECGTYWVALPASIGERRDGPTEAVLERIDAKLGTSLQRLTERGCLPRFNAAETRAHWLTTLFSTYERQFHGTLALAVCADQAHAPAILARVSAWHRTRVALVRAGMGLAAPVSRVVPREGRTWSTVLDQMKHNVAEASPLASITRTAVAMQVLVLCAVACYGGPSGLRCVLAGLAAAMQSQIPNAVARALGNATKTLAEWLPAEIREMLAPTADVRCAASSMVGLLSAAGLVPALAAIAVQAAADCPPATIRELPYDAPCRLIAMACDFSAAALRLESLSHTDPPKLPAGSAPGWLRWNDEGRPEGRPEGDEAEWRSAITKYLADTERIFVARNTLADVLRHFPYETRSAIPDAMHGILATLTVCAIAAASGMWGPSTSLARGTMLSYLAWHNPALGSALHLCIREG